MGVADDVISILETAEAEFAKSKIDVTNLEQGLITAYKTKIEDFSDEVQVTKQTVKGYTAQIASLEKSISDTETDEANAMTEEEAAQEYLILTILIDFLPVLFRIFKHRLLFLQTTNYKPADA